MADEEESVATGSVASVDKKNVSVQFKITKPWEWDPFDFPNSVILNFGKVYNPNNSQLYGIRNIDALKPYD